MSNQEKNNQYEQKIKEQKQENEKFLCLAISQIVSSSFNFLTLVTVLLSTFSLLI